MRSLLREPLAATAAAVHSTLHASDNEQLRVTMSWITAQPQKRSITHTHST